MSVFAMLSMSLAVFTKYKATYWPYNMSICQCVNMHGIEQKYTFHWVLFSILGHELKTCYDWPNFPCTEAALYYSKKKLAQKGLFFNLIYGHCQLDNSHSGTHIYYPVVAQQITVLVKLKCVPFS